MKRTITRKGFLAAVAGLALPAAAKTKAPSPSNTESVMWSEMVYEDGEARFLQATPGAETILGMKPEEAARRFTKTGVYVLGRKPEDVWFVTVYPFTPGNGALRFTGMAPLGIFHVI